MADTGYYSNESYVDNVELLRDSWGFVQAARDPVTGGIEISFPDGAVPMRSVPGVVVNDQSKAASNAAAIQKALDQKGHVFIGNRGIVYLGSTPLIDSDTRLTLGHGTTLKSADGLAINLLGAKNQASAKVTLSNMTLGEDIVQATSGALVAVTFDTSLAHGWSKGADVLLKGDTTDQWIGWHRVWAVPSPTSVTFLIPGPLTTSNYNVVIQPPSGTLTGQLCIANVIIEGGAWDGSAPSRQASDGYSYSAFGLNLNKVCNVSIRDMTILNVSKYAICLTNAFGYSVDNITFRSASDGVHLQGPCRQGALSRLHGSNYDDLVSYTATNAGYESYNFPGYVSSAAPGAWDQDGELVNLIMRDIQPQRKNLRILLGPKASYRCAGIVIDGYQPQYDGATDSIVISSESASMATVEDVTIRCANGRKQGATTGRLISIGIGGDAAATTLKKLVIENLNLSGHVGNVIDTQAHHEIISFVNCDMTLDATAVTRYVVNPSGPVRAIKKIEFSGCRLSSSGAQGAYWVALAPNVTIQESSWRSCIFGAGVSAVKGSSPNVPVLRFSQITLDTGANALVGHNNNCTIVADDILQIAAAQAMFNLYASSGVSYNLYITKLRAVSGSLFLNFGATGTKNLFVGDGTVALDGTTITPKPGALFYNTNAAYGAGVGLYAMGAAATTRIAA